MAILRQLRFYPTADDESRNFILTLWDTGQIQLGRKKLGYSLYCRTGAMECIRIFRAENFGCPLEKDAQSNETVMKLIEFLTWPLDDVVEDRWKELNNTQRAFVQRYGQPLKEAAKKMLFWDGYEDLYKNQDADELEELEEVGGES